MSALLKKFSNLLCVKSIVTLVYFGTQSQRLNEKIEKDTDKKQL